MGKHISFAGTMRSITELGLTLEGCRQLMSFPSADPAMVQIRRIERKATGKYEIEIFFPTISMIESFLASPGQKPMTADEIAMLSVFGSHFGEPEPEPEESDGEEFEEPNEETSDDDESEEAAEGASES